MKAAASLIRSDGDVENEKRREVKTGVVWRLPPPET